ncbi:response regulator [Clostridium algoriphilum]|uniref:cobalamin-dependent protein n=1 Tax=Clostridium algoriphilum TaxID=198347 RepID=UPI001CF1FD78|nr:cobalamin-dependent protein [Clostridium algoriphilum]MCB2294504.1 response regulator [Clostridium algoriphilum]
MKELSKVFIFILDNIKSVRVRLQLLFKTDDINIIEASNSSEFFNAFSQNKYNGNLIIMDIKLKGEDGFQVIRKIRNKNPNIPIIILTANNNREILIKAIFEGATDYILKPFEDLRIKNKTNEILDSYNSLKNINQEVYRFISSNKKELAEKILSRQFFYQPELKLEYIDDNYKKYLKDISYHLSYLCEAINLNSLELFNDYILWTKASTQDLNSGAEHIVVNLNCIKDILYPELSKKMVIIVNRFIDAANKNLLSTDTSSKTFVDKNNACYNISVEYLDLLLKMERIKASKLIMNEVEKGIPIKDIYVYVFEPSLKEIGNLWHKNKITVAEEHYFTATTQLIMAQLYSRIIENNRNGLKFVAVCVSAEIHEVGIRMVTDMLEVDGWDTYYLGANVPKRDLISFLIKQKPHVLGLSATMIFNLQNVKEIIEEVRNIEELKDIKILVGGYPFNMDKELWKKMGADLYAPNAIETCNLVANTFKSDVS